jgi:hypothetical protein
VPVGCYALYHWKYPPHVGLFCKIDKAVARIIVFPAVAGKGKARPVLAFGSKIHFPVINIIGIQNKLVSAGLILSFGIFREKMQTRFRFQSG